MLVWFTIAALAVVAVLCMYLRRRFATSRIDALLDKRRAASRMVSCGEFVDGNRRLKVAVALTTFDLLYENADLEASLDLRCVREIEYDSTLSTGQAVTDGKVLRLRSFSQLFEFVLPNDVVTRWQLLLPPRQRKESAGPELVAPAVMAT